MKSYNNLTFSQRIKCRIYTLRFAAVCMLIYMIVISELGGGDSRIMTPLADVVSDILFYGGLFYVLTRIGKNKKLLQDQHLLKQKMLLEKDERNQYLHDKSGGIVMDIVLLITMFVTCTAALFDMAAFYASFAILMSMIILKIAVWLYFDRINGEI